MPRVLALLVLALALAAPTAAAAEVRILNGFFDPDVIRAAPGEPIVFVNEDDVAHTVTSSWDGGAAFHHIVRPGESVTVTLHEEGTYAIHCMPHATQGEGGHYEGMVATIEVAAVATSADAAGGGLVGWSSIALGALALIAVAGAWRIARQPRAS